MSDRRATRVDALALALAGAVGLLAAASGSADERAFKPPRTSDGHPDLHGYWTNNTVVRLERPAQYAGRAELTEEETKERLKQQLEPEPTEPGTDADVHYQLTDYGLDISQRVLTEDRRTSLITDPADGKVPAARPEAVKAAQERAAYRRAHGFDSAQDRPLGERCIVWGHQGPPIMPTGYNSNLEIYQAPGYVVIVTEMLPDPRIVPLDGRPHISKDVHQWLGDSRGHYEGDTLVIETTNYTGRTAVQGIPGGVLLTPDARVVERFDLAGPDTIRYRFTVEDKNVWERSWSAEYPMIRIEGLRFEYACQEGNYGMANVLSGARASERAAAESGKPQ